jgi:hypothetical protein
MSGNASHTCFACFPQLHHFQILGEANIMEQTQNSLARPGPNTENVWPKIMGILANTLAESYQEIAGRAFAGSLSLCPTGLSFSLATTGNSTQQAALNHPGTEHQVLHPAITNLYNIKCDYILIVGLDRRQCQHPAMLPK